MVIQFVMHYLVARNWSNTTSPGKYCKKFNFSGEAKKYLALLLGGSGTSRCIPVLLWYLDATWVSQIYFLYYFIYIFYKFLGLVHTLILRWYLQLKTSKFMIFHHPVDEKVHFTRIEKVITILTSLINWSMLAWKWKNSITRHEYDKVLSGYKTQDDQN